MSARHETRTTRSDVAADPSAGQGAPRSAGVGMVGGGQLARMTFRAAIDLGVQLHVLCPAPLEPAPAAGATWHQGTPDDLAALERFAAAVDVITLDHELVPVEGLNHLVEQGHSVWPKPSTLAYAQNKLHARRQLQAAGAPIPAFVDVATVDDVVRFADDVGWPVVLKTQTGGYDGRGVQVAADIASAREILAADTRWLAEAHVKIDTEIAVLVARRPSGAHVVYPVVETVQQDGICVELVMPARIAPDVARRAQKLAVDIAELTGAVGIFAVELFVDAEGRLIVNEVATRPHNSGHATIEGCVTSQFSNHLRAVLDWPLGDTAMRHPFAVTVNLLGAQEPAEPLQRVAAALSADRLQVHLYGKQWRPGRKLGHVTVTGDAPDELLEVARHAAQQLTAP